MGNDCTVIRYPDYVALDHGQSPAQCTTPLWLNFECMANMHALIVN